MQWRSRMYCLDSHEWSRVCCGLFFLSLVQHCTCLSSLIQRDQVLSLVLIFRTLRFLGASCYVYCPPCFPMTDSEYAFLSGILQKQHQSFSVHRTRISPAPAFLRSNRHVTLYEFKVYGILI